MNDPFSRDIFRTARFFLGAFVYSFGVVTTMRANIGYSPWFVFHHGVGLHLGITIGQATMLVSVIIVAIGVLAKESVGFGTIGNTIFIGIFVDIIASWSWFPLMQSFVSGVAVMLGGFFFIAIGSVLYIGAGYGAGPRDTFMVVVTKRSGKPVGFCRGCIESTVLLAGWLLGGYAGLGTIISAFGIGVVIQIVFSALRFDVKKIRQESFYETFLRLKNALVS